MNNKIKVFIVVGARPNFMKIAPLLNVINKGYYNLLPIVVHTGQHYDFNMSDSFFIDLGITEPHYYLGAGSGTHAEQTAKIMMAFEKTLLKEQPEVLIVVGDVNSTLACTVVASKISYSAINHSQVPFIKKNRRPLIVHVEAGLRSYDRTMPEEINRIVTDSLSDLLFTSEPSASDNLLKEGIPMQKVHFVGNVMIDALEIMKEKVNKCPIVNNIGLAGLTYGVLTLHRPSNVDNFDNLSRIVEALLKISEKVAIVFPIHPRTKNRLEEHTLINLLEKDDNIVLLEPLSYKEFMKVLFESTFVITDSGGLQEESTYLGIPCVTLRPNTERPITVIEGTNELINVTNIEERIDQILTGRWKKGSVPEYWDGQTAHRIISILMNQLEII